MRCGAVHCYLQRGAFMPFWCGLTKTITVLYLIFTVTCAVRYGLEFSENHNRTAPHFCSHMCDVTYKMRFERYEVSIFFKFWFFPTQPKTNFFPFVFDQVLNYWASFALFWAGFHSQHLIGLSNFFFCGKLGLLNY